MASGLYGNAPKKTKAKAKAKSATRAPSYTDQLIASANSGDYSAYGVGGSVWNSQVPAAARDNPQPPQPVARSPYGDPNSMLDQLGQGSPYPGFSDTADYNAQASQIYAPQTDYLANLEKQSIARGEKSGHDMDALYAALAKSIGQQAGGIKSNYNDAMRDSQGIYGQTSGDLNNAFNNSRNGVNAALQRLGIQEAGANTNQKQSEMQGLMSTILGANNQAQQNNLVAGRQSALDYNTANQTGAKLAGGEARVGLAKQLNDFLNQIGLKKADLKTQINQWAIDAQGKAAGADYDHWKDAQGFDLQRQKMAQDAGQYADDLEYKYNALNNKTSKEADPTKLDPVGDIGAMANKMYGNPQAAANAVKAVMDTIQFANQGQTDSLQSFLSYLDQRNQHNGHSAGDLGNLRALGTEYYRRMYK